MKLRTSCFVVKIFAIVAFIAAPVLCSGQNKTDTKLNNSGKSAKKHSEPVWTKMVVREIYFADTAENDEYKISDGYKLRTEHNDLSFGELIANALKENKIVGYDTSDFHFTKALSQQQIKILFGPTLDRVNGDNITDTGVEYEFVSHDFDYNSITKYRILEKWTYNTQSSETIVQIVGIGPEKDNYAQYGDYRGQRPLLWVKYEDIKNLLVQYQVTHPGYDFNIPVWKDFFSEKEVK